MRLALIGWGAIARTVAATIDHQQTQLVAVAVRNVDKPRADLPVGTRLITEPAELTRCEADLVVEAAGREAVEPWGRASLSAGVDLVVSSVSAFADPVLLADLKAAASETDSQLHIQPGALAGVEALAAARHMGIDAVEHRIIKPPKAWQGTPAETLCQLDSLSAAAEFFRSTAADTAARFPKNANVAMTTALAGIGPEQTIISLVADPSATTNRHEVTATGAFGQLEVAIANNPLPDNPKTSAMAALSLVRLINNRRSAIVI